MSNSNSSKPSCSLLGGSITAIVIAIIYGLFQLLTGGGGPTPVPEPVSNAASGDASTWVQVLFTDPFAPEAKTLRGGPDALLAEAIDGARISVDAALYDLNLWSIRDALIAAHQRGVTVRIVAETDNLDDPGYQDLKEAGIPIISDRREGRMHNKFVIIDQSQVWTGSMNLTVNGAYRNNNNLISIRSARLAQDYTTEFEEMFVNDQFGPTSPANTPYPQITVDNTLIEVYFSPEDDPINRILELVSQAQESIAFMAFSFTSDDLSDALIAQAQNNLSVSGVMETTQYNTNTGTEYDHLLQNGVDVRLDGNPHNMHHKVIIIDGKIVITGSYNFSASAEKSNDENVLIIHDPQIAAQYLQEFGFVYDQGN